MIAAGGPFQVLFDQSDIVVAKRVGTSPAVDVTPQDTACAGQTPIAHVDVRRAGGRWR